jgi:hypothetical protein
MRMTREGGTITLRDRAAPYWFLGLFLLSGGLLAIAMPLGLAVNAGELAPWERHTSLMIGMGVSAGALWYLARSSATIVRLDLTRRMLTLVRIGLTGRQVRRLQFTEIASLELDESKDSDGDPIWRPALRLASGETVLLSELWSHDRKAVRAGAAIVAESCRLPFQDGEIASAAPPPRND